MSYELVLSVHIIVAIILLRKGEERIIFFVFFSFTYGVLGQVWYLILSIPDLSFLPYLL